MSTAYQEAKKLHDELKKSGNDPVALSKLVDFMEFYVGDDQIVHSLQLEDEIQELEKEDRHMTGVTRLDEILDGFRSNQLVAISAPPKAGKTQFCVHIARSMKNPTMFLFEESPAEVLYKYKKKGLPLPRFYTMQTNLTDGMEQLYRKMIEAWIKYDSKIFFVDHLHYLLDDDSRDNTSYKIKKVMQELKEFAKLHGFTIILIAHMTKGHFTEPPGIEAIRDSSFIPQYADTTIILWRETYQSGAKEHKNVYNYTNNLLINVALNRKINFKTDRNTGLVDLTFNTETWGYEDSIWYTDWVENGNKEEQEKKSLKSQLKV